MHEPSFYWHDYETWGATPSIDRPSQFAGLRTNLALEPVAEPDVWFCKPTVDVLPHPDAVLTYRASDMVLACHSDASYLIEPKAAVKQADISSCGRTRHFHPTTDQS